MSFRVFALATIAAVACGGQYASPSVDAGVIHRDVITLASGQASPGGIAVDATSVYWTNGGGPLLSDGGCDPTAKGAVMKVSLGGGDAITLASGQDQPLGIALDAANVYWTNRGYCKGTVGTVMRAPLGGGDAITLASGQNNPSGIAVDAVNVYWTNYGDGTVMMVPVRGGTATVLASLGTNAGPAGIAVDGTSVYWTTYPGGHATGTVWKVSLTGGDAVTLASGVQQITDAIAVDSTTVYWTNYTNVMSVPRGGGTATTLASGLDVAHHPSGIAVDTTSVYWTNLDGNTVMKVPLRGGKATVLAAQYYPSGIAVDATSVYWTNWMASPTASLSTPSGTVMKLTPK